jgi:hypothetical protein
MKVFDVSSLFMYEDPKSRCRVYDVKYELIYDGRIEFLVNCNNPIEYMTIVSMQLGDLDDNEKFIDECIVMNVK